MKSFSITKNLFINAPPTLLFETLTNSEKIIQYYPLKEVISDWQVGSDIILKGNNNGEDFIDYGRIEVLTPNQKFQYTYWSDNHGTDRTPENQLTICYTLDEVDRGTNLQLEHTNLKSEQMYSEMLKVWDLLLSGLKSFVESGQLKNRE